MRLCADTYLHMRTSLVVMLLWPGMARANDLGDAVAYAGSLAALEVESPPDSSEALAMLNSRDVRPGAALETYQCDDGLIDSKGVLRTNSFLRLSDRACREEMWNRSSLPGYRTLGQVRLTAHEVRPWIHAAALETEIPETILETIIRYESGYRPGVISERGDQGLMQLTPAAIAEQGLRNPLDGEANVRAGARYLRSLVDHFDGALEPALAAYRLGIAAVEANDGLTPDDRHTLWFVREVRRLYKAEVDDVSVQQGAEDIVYVMTWLDRPVPNSPASR